MKLNINIFKRKKKCEAYVGKYLNGRKPEGTAQKAVYISRENHEAVKRIVGMAGGQAVYISRENHEAVKRIVGMAGGHGMTISGYIDHIVTEHLDRHGAELENLHRRKSHGVVEQITINQW